MLLIIRVIIGIENGTKATQRDTHQPDLCVALFTCMFDDILMQTHRNGSVPVIAEMSVDRKRVHAPIADKVEKTLLSEVAVTASPARQHDNERIGSASLLRRNNLYRYNGLGQKKRATALHQKSQQGKFDFHLQISIESAQRRRPGNF